MNITRRTLLGGAAAAAFATVSPNINAAFGAVPNGNILVIVFQRGACDWLQMLAPAGDANYKAARPTIGVTTSGTNAGLPLGTLGGVDLYLHKGAPELKTLYNSGSLAFIHASGVHTSDRSHFLCQAMMERGLADGDPLTTTGWLARHVQSTMTGTPSYDIVNIGPSTPASLVGNVQSVSITKATNFTISGSTSMPGVIASLNAGSTPYQTAVAQTLQAVSKVNAGLKTISTANTAGYTSGPFSQSLQTVAELIKMNIGLSVAVVDFDDWDMHSNLAAQFNSRTVEFSKSLNAFWTDMAAYRSKITLVTMTEFGRRLQENSNYGTDHGSAGGMLVLGGNVNGGKIYGTWPGLAASQLYQGDLAVTTDYRQILAEVLVELHGETKLATVFPTLKYAPLGIVHAAT
jgi:uncharacterized protein (DUF1501 family)